MILLLLLGCADGDERCDEWPEEPAEVSGVIDSDSDDCGYWALPVAEHLYINVIVTEELVDCAYDMGPGIGLFAQPTWSNFTGGGMKWTYDVVGETPSEDWTGFEVDCDDGATFSARILVTD